MISQFDPRALDLARKDGDAHAETRAKYAAWAYLAYMADDDAAERALDALIAALYAQHGSARSLVGNARPAPYTMTRRAATGDEGER